MEKTYQIRYNTKSTDDSTSWRLICDGEETLVEDVHITTKTYTSKDWIDELKQHKHHISCTGHLLVKNNIAYITENNKELSIRRHLAKTISYRFMATFLTIGTALVLGLDIQSSALLGIGEMVIKPFFYFFHERIWYNLRFQKKNK